jgi:hypothetical protein
MCIAMPITVMKLSQDRVGQDMLLAQSDKEDRCHSPQNEGHTATELWT